jgi:site-specific recombinase XerC
MTSTLTPETMRCYTEDWHRWCTWCGLHSVNPMRCTVDDLIRCLHEWRATGLSPSTVGRRRAAVGYYHRQAGAPPVANDYAIRAVMSEMHRSARPPRGKTELRAADLTRIYHACEADPQRLRGLRDRAILAVGWSSAQARSKLAGLRVADLSDRRRLPHLSDEARRWTLEWLQAAKIVDGALFRRIVSRRLQGRWKPATETVGTAALSGHAIATVVKSRCAAIGKAKSFFSASSLRAGRLAYEVRRGTDVRDIMGLARVHTLTTVVRRAGTAREAKGAPVP